jgi:hypothetical protein
MKSQKIRRVYYKKTEAQKGERAVGTATGYGLDGLDIGVRVWVGVRL